MLLNIDKIKKANTGNVSLPEQSFNNFVQNACDYFKALETDINKINPNEVIDIISALAAFREYFERETDWEHLTLNMLNILQKGIKRSIYDDIASFSGMTHVAFAIHDLAAAAPKAHSFLESVNKVLLENLNTYLKASDSNEFYTEGNFEVISGLSGPLSYLLYTNDNNDASITNMTQRIIDIFIKRSKDITILEHRVPGWHYYPSDLEKSFMTTEAKNGVVNYGLSHGMAASLVVLSLAYKNGFDGEGMTEAIDGLISEFMKAHYYTNDIAYWPGRITFEQYTRLDELPKGSGQMSWCYGSVGILRSLYLSGALMDKSEVKQFALDELLKIAEMDLSDYMLGQTIVCHGFVGTAAILNAMYLDTGKVQFIQKTVEMIEICATLNIEQFFKFEEELAHRRGAPFRGSLHQHLEGYNGIIQTIFSILQGSLKGNEKRLLII